MSIARSTLACAIALGFAAPAFAQADAPKDNAAIKDAHTVNDGGAMRGANSFTENQAHEHIANAGYSSVSKLMKDHSGVWRGTAMKSGRKVHVGLDFKGNVVTSAR